MITNHNISKEGRQNTPYTQGFYAAMDNPNIMVDNPYNKQEERDSWMLWEEGYMTYLECCYPLPYDDVRL